MSSLPPEDRRALRVYRFLLLLFPPSFREDRGGDLERLFLDMRAERRRWNRGLGPTFWVPLVWDTAFHGLRERLSRLPGLRASAGPSDSDPGLLMTGLWTDLRYAARSVARRPLYGTMIVLMMTLGIAGNAAVFRIFNGLLLRPLPFQDSEQLVDLDVRAPRWDLEFVSVAYPDFHRWRAENETFQGMTAYDEGGANLAGEDGAIRVDVAQVTHDMAPVLGLRMELGRFFTPEEDVPDGPKVALISEGLWDRRYARDREIVGSSVTLDGVPHEVIGVLPPAAGFAFEADVWVPLQGDPTRGGSFSLGAVGRLKPGVSVAQAVDDLTRIHKGMVEERPVNESTFPVIHSLRDRYLGEARVGGAMLLGAVLVVLLIACANVAGLMLARSMDRTREVGIRMAMGARRGRIVRQLLTESLLLAGTGAALGTVLGVFGSSALVERMAAQFPRWITFDLDWRFVVFTVGVTLAAALLFGMAPALQTSRTDAAGALQAGSTRSTPSRGRRRAMSVLVAGEVGLALVLLVVSGLGIQDLRHLQSADPGFRTEGILTYRVELPEASYETPQERLNFYRAHLDRIRAMPGVSSAAGASILPLSGHSGYFFQAEGAPERGEDEPNPVVLVRAVTPGYLETMGVTLLAGRGLTEFDGREEGSRAVVVNESFAREFLDHESDPLEGRIRTGGGDMPWVQVVGVTRDVKHYGVDQEMRPGVYLPLNALAVSSLQVAVRTPGDPTGLVPPIRQALQEQDSRIALFQAGTMAERMEESLWSRRASSWLIGVFSAVALLLAVAGIYGVISYGVSQRVREIGIRKALGARRGRVLGEIFRQGMLIVGLGVLAGLVGAYAVAGLISDTLVGVSPTDPKVYAGVTALLLVVAGLANLLPARRAARLDPMGVLRGE